MSGIFICYRREDSTPHAGRLYDRLVEIFGAERVFMDVDGIQPGEDFVETIEAKVGSCNAMVVVIGKQWLKAAGEGDRSRLDDPEDYVRLEIVTALQRKVRVIPVLVAGARMPRPEDLPSDLAKLARRQAVAVNDASFRQSLAQLIGALENALTGCFNLLQKEEHSVDIGSNGRLRFGDYEVDPQSGKLLTNSYDFSG